MADKKISQLPPAAALTGDELVPVVQSGVTLQSTAGAIRGTAASLPGFDDAAEAVADDVLAAHTGAADPHPQYATPAEAAAAAPVQSVAGQIGAVVLLKSDVGLGSVDNTADIDNGKAKFAMCRSCHTIVEGGANLTGPNLHGVFGRKAGALDNYKYSEAVKNAGFVWDAEHLDKWLAEPRTFLPGSGLTPGTGGRICRRSGRFSPQPGTFPASGARRYSPTAWTGRTGITF